jgi:hypothetical protein
MKSTLILKNIGNQPSAEVTVQVSYFVKFKESSQVKTQEFILTVKSNQEHRQEIDFGDSTIKELEVLVLVQKPKGNIITQKSFVLQDIADKTPLISFALNEEIDIETAPPVEMPKPNFVYGRLLDKKGIHNMEDIQIIISAKRDGENDFETITSVTTEAQGYFSIEYPLGNFTEAVALVGLELAENPIPIRLSKKVVNQSGDPTTVLVFPPRMILIAELKEAIVSTEDAQDCGCSANEFGEKKVLEEFSFYSLVRTSEPVIKGYVIEDEDEITLEDVLRNLPYSVFEIIEPLKAFPYISRKSPIRLMKAAVEPAIARAVSDDDNFLETIKNIKIKKSVLNNFIKDEHTITKDNIAKLFAQNEAFVFYNTINDIEPANPKPLGRVELGIDNAIDWDDEPTIYQAVTVAHGHLLQYKSEWIADGYSLGDLLYSLPLAPGQKKQIVVFDWERRESASNSQSIDYEESLFNSLSRDRDILEIAKGTIEENVSGRSSATVKAVAGGIGGVIGSAVFGVAGGYSNARSRASQDSLRQVSSSDQQKLSDRIVQSANAVRSMRSTVIQTVAQGERFEVSSESVANYNHCHALTIQYYEVLRHFKIRQRFAGARECLFVPLLMSQFDLKKSLRWRESLQLALIDRRLAKGFDAGDRILHEWQDANFPSGTFASESIITAAGVLQIRFVLQRPIDEIVEVDDTDRAPVFPGNQYSSTVWHKKKIGKIISANWQKLTPFLDGISPEEFHKDYLEGAADKDAVFHQMIGEKVAREFVRNLVFDVEDNTGRSIGNIPIDTSITSRYARNGMLRVTLRLNQPTSFARDKFHYLRIKTKIITGSLFGVNIPVNLGDILPDGSYLTVESGFMRYKTNHFDGFLFKYQDLGDDLTATDGVTIYAGPSSEELKDPRKEDLVLANKLIAHLNDNLEYYHKVIWLNMTAQRRFMLLDGIILNEDEKEKGGGRSVASLVENDLISIVGNSLVFPVAPGLNLNPDFGTKESLTEFYMTAAAEPISVSVPTKGVFAEAVMGKCNSCEKIEEDRFWRWEESPIPDSPTAITPINTDTRRADPGNLQPQALPNPIVNIQNVPNAPDPSGLSATLGLLGQSNIFKDITGLEGNQKNAMQAFQSSLDAAKTFAQEAGKLEVQKVMEKRLDKAINAIDNDKSLSPEKKAELKEKALNAYMGAGATKEEPQDESPSKPTLTDAAIKVAEAGGKVEAESNDAKSGKSEKIKIESKPNPFDNKIENIPFVGQQKKTNGCWAAAATMMVSWHDKKVTKAYSITQVLEKAGAKYVKKFNNNEPLLASEKEDFIAALSMVGEDPEKSDQFTLSTYMKMLADHGPLWITTDSSDDETFSPHARILIGYSGGGKEEDTNLIFLDPSEDEREIKQNYVKFFESLKQMRRDNPTDTSFIAVVHFDDKKLIGEGRKKAFNPLEHHFFDSTSSSTKILTPIEMKTSFYEMKGTLTDDSERLVIIKNPALDSKLQNLIESNLTYKKNKKDFAVSIVDMTGSKKANPEYAGHNDTLSFYAGSTAKITGMIATYQLKFDINSFLKEDPSIADMPSLEKAMKVLWKLKQIDPSLFPKLRLTFDFIPSTRSVEIKNELKNVFNDLSGLKSKNDGSHGNEAGATAISLIGYHFIASTMISLGLANSTGGLWVWKNYGMTKMPELKFGGKKIRKFSWNYNPFPKLEIYSVNAVSVAQFYTLCAQGRLIDEDSSKAMIDHLVQGGCITELSSSGRLTQDSSNIFATKCGIIGDGKQIANKTIFEFNHNPTYFKGKVNSIDKEFSINILTKNYKVLDIADSLFDDILNLL